MLEPLWEVMSCPMLLYRVHQGRVAGKGFSAQDLPSTPGHGMTSGPFRLDPHEPISKRVIRFHDQASIRRQNLTGIYSMGLPSGHWHDQVVLTTVDDHCLLAWLLFCRSGEEGAFTEEEMDFLDRFQPHFEGAGRRVLRIESRWGRRALIRRIAHEHNLSDQEAKVLEAALSGEPNHRIADALGISSNTVRHHLEHIFIEAGHPSSRRAYGSAAPLSVDGHRFWLLLRAC